MKLVMDLVVNHTSDEHPWFVESRDPTSPKRDWYWWRPPRPGMAAGAPGAEPTNWGSFFSGSVWELDEASGEYYLHLFSRKQPDLNWENDEVRRGGLRDDALVAGPRGRRLPDGRHQRDLQGPVAAGRTGARRRSGPTASASYVCGPRIHEFLAEMHQAVFAGRPDRLLTVGEMPGVTVEQARAFTDPARGEVDMVFQFEHVGLDHGPGGKFDVAPAAAGRPQGVVRPLAGRAGRRRLEQPLLGQPRPAAGRVAVRRRRRTSDESRRRCSRPSCTCTAARRTSTRARSSG